MQSLMPAVVIRQLWVALGADAFLCKSHGSDTEPLQTVDYKPFTISPLGLAQVHMTTPNQ